jgi:hypothetical protein
MNPYLLLIDISAEKVSLLENNLKNFTPHQKIANNCYFLFGEHSPQETLRKLIINLEVEKKLFLIQLPQPIVPADLR